MEVLWELFLLLPPYFGLQRLVVENLSSLFFFLALSLPISIFRAFFVCERESFYLLNPPSPPPPKHIFLFACWLSLPLKKVR